MSSLRSVVVGQDRVVLQILLRVFLHREVLYRVLFALSLINQFVFRVKIVVRIQNPLLSHDEHTQISRSNLRSVDWQSTESRFEPSVVEVH